MPDKKPKPSMYAVEISRVLHWLREYCEVLKLEREYVDEKIQRLESDIRELTGK